MGAVTQTSTMAGDVLQHLLDQTSIDDQVIDAVCGHVGTAKDFTANVVGQIAGVDYNEVVRNLTKHEIYVAHVAPAMDKVVSSVAPAMDKVAEGAQPYVDLYVSPALKSAKLYADPALETAKETYACAAKAVEGDVLPRISQVSTEIP